MIGPIFSAYSPGTCAINVARAQVLVQNTQMKLKANLAALVEYADREGKDAAAVRFSTALNCSLSKAQKMARGNWPYKFSVFEQRALVAATKLPQDVLFQAPGKAKEQAS
jgi:hypothetical protein